MELFGDYIIQVQLKSIIFYKCLEMHIFLEIYEENFKTFLTLTSENVSFQRFIYLRGEGRDRGSKSLNRFPRNGETSLGLYLSN